MRKVERSLGDGIIEERYYDKDNKLVDVRKKYPPMTVHRLYLHPVGPGVDIGH